MEFKFQPYHIPGKCVGVKINGPSKESIEKGLRHFKMLFKTSGRVDELKDRQGYVSKSQQRREVVKKARFIQSKRNNF